MSNNILEMTLGLAGTGAFLSALGSAQAGLQSLIGTALSFGAITAGVMSAFEKGASLEKLHKMTGESVGDIYKLQRGFEACGASADNVGPAVLAMQRALGGTNELGEKTADIFQRMGLSASLLKREGAPQQFAEITAALGKLNASDASKAASSIFGRQNAATVLEIARSADDFQRAIREAATQAAIFERVAKSFEKIDLLMRSIKNNFGNFFVGIADAIEPSLEKALTKIKNFSGKLGPAIAGAVKTGQLEELVQDALMAAFEQGGYYASRIFSAVAVGFGVAVGAALLAALKDFVPAYASSLANAGKLLASRHRENEAIYYSGEYTKLMRESQAAGDKPGALDWSRKAQAANKDVITESEYQNSLLGAQSAQMMTHVQEAVSKVGDGFVKGFSGAKTDWNKTDDPDRPHAQLDKFNKRLADLDKAAGNGVSSGGGGGGGGGGGDGMLQKSSYTYKPDSTTFEKMGFVMSGGASNPATEHARRTAFATEKTATLLETAVQLLSGGGGPYEMVNKL